MSPLHASDVNDAHVPENSCERLRPAVPDVCATVIVGVVLLATKRYHTSATAVPHPGRPVPAVYVAAVSVPAVTRHACPGVSNVALPQRLFAGWANAKHGKRKDNGIPILTKIQVFARKAR